jgi:hypothetical protein
MRRALLSLPKEEIKKRRSRIGEIKGREAGGEGETDNLLTARRANRGNGLVAENNEVEV